MPAPILAVCEPKFTKFLETVEDSVQFPMPLLGCPHRVFSEDIRQ